MGEREDVVADAAAVGVVGGDAEVGLVVKQAVDDVCRLAGRRDCGDMVGRVPGGMVRVEQRRRVVAVARVNRADRLATAQASAIRVRPRLVASASTAVSTTRRSATGKPVWRWVKALLKPVQRSTSSSTLVMRALGTMP